MPALSLIWVRWWLPVTMLALSTASCGVEKPGGHSEDADPRVCSVNWKVIFSPQQHPFGSSPSVLQWSDGRLFTSVFPDRRPRVFSIPDSGGSETELIEWPVWRLWTEGERLLFAQPGPTSNVDGRSVSDTFLYSMPAGGGPADLLVTSHVDTVDTNPLPTGWGLDERALYWIQMEYGPSIDSNIWTAWSSARDGSGDKNLGRIPVSKDGSLLYSLIQPVRDRLIVFSYLTLENDLAFSVAKDGSDVTVLPSWPGYAIGVSGAGTILFRRSTNVPNGEKRADHYEVGRLLYGGAQVESFWPGKPASSLPLFAWDDGHGGFYVSLLEWGVDDATHLTMWNVGDDGTGRRLACDPLVSSTITAAAVAPDGIYVVVSYSNQYWEIAKISRGD